MVVQVGSYCGGETLCGARGVVVYVQFSLIVQFGSDCGSETLSARFAAQEA